MLSSSTGLTQRRALLGKSVPAQRCGLCCEEEQRERTAQQADAPVAGTGQEETLVSPRCTYCLVFKPRVMNTATHSKWLYFVFSTWSQAKKSYRNPAGWKASGFSALSAEQHALLMSAAF